MPQVPVTPGEPDDTITVPNKGGGVTENRNEVIITWRGGAQPDLVAMVNAQGPVKTLSIDVYNPDRTQLRSTESVDTTPGGGKIAVIGDGISQQDKYDVFWDGELIYNDIVNP